MTEHEELLKLRALVAKMDAQLAEKDQIIDKQTEQLKNQTEQLAKQSEQIEERNERIAKLNIRLENMIQALLHARKKLFGPSTECTKQVEGQLSLSIFETSQELARELAEAQKKITVKPHTRVARQPGVREEMLAGLPKEIEEYVIPADETCSVCGGDLKIIGKRLIRTEVEFEPAKLKVKQIVQQIAKCTICGTDKGDNPSCHFQKAAVPTPPLAHSISTPSLVAQVMYQKFALGLPLARQEKDWFR